MAEEKKSGFTVTDRRFGAEDEAAQQATPPSQSTTAEAPAADAGKATGEHRIPVPTVDFPTFILSLGSSALMHLGEFAHPETGKPQRDLALAKHTIDIISMLEEKTRGNLTADEAKLIESLLFDLRLKYIDASKAKG